jgi:hypothetical protein
VVTCVEAQQLPESATETAHFLMKVNSIFDSMNSRTKVSGNKFKCAVSNAADEHLKVPLETIEEGMEWVASWTALNAEKTLHALTDLNTH